jgi:hypothetical protein
MAYPLWHFVLRLADAGLTSRTAEPPTAVGDIQR